MATQNGVRQIVETRLFTHKHTASFPALHVLRWAAYSVFVSVSVTQLLFAYYIFDFYILNLLAGHTEEWNRRLFKGLINGDHPGNFAVITHLLLSFVIAVTGPVQFAPGIRVRFRKFHRLNGRAFLASAFLISLSGLYLIAMRGGVNLSGDISLALNGILILLFALQALRFATSKDFRRHRRWALRLFYAVSGFLFGRLGFQVWIFLSGGWGHTPSYTGPFDVLWGFGMYVVPLAILEIYFIVQGHSNAIVKLIVSGLLMSIAVLILLGSGLAMKNLWLPFI